MTKSEKRRRKKKALPERVQNGRTVMADIMSSAEKDHKGERTLQSVIAAVLGNQLPCPHESCRNSQGRVKFYSENGIEQHWKASHSGKTKRLGIKSIKAMGNKLLKNLHCSRLSSIYEEQFCKDEQVSIFLKTSNTFSVTESM